VLVVLFRILYGYGRSDCFVSPYHLTPYHATLHHDDDIPAPPHPLLSSSLTSSSSNTTPMKSHLALPIPSLPPTHTPAELSAHIAHLRKIKSDFLDLLTEEQKELLGMEVDSMGDDWFVGLRGEFVKPYFLEVSCGDRGVFAFLWRWRLWRMRVRDQGRIGS
jgi:hypothetical protein